MRTLFRMPDLLSIGLGGGTLCDPDDPSRIGPVSVGFRLTERARVFGGPDLTATDVAVAAGWSNWATRPRWPASTRAMSGRPSPACTR